MEVGGHATPRPLYTRNRESVSNIQEAGWAPGPVSMDAENLAPNLDSIPETSSP